MKKGLFQWILLLSIMALLVLSPFDVKADGPDGESSAGKSDPDSTETIIDWSQYSYDELLLIRDNLNEYIHEMERQYAIENGNRIITLSDAEVTLYIKKTHNLTAEIKRVVEDAPTKTTLTWKSSDESVAKVSNTGVVTGIGYGNATITCTASDDEYIFAESVVHVVLPVSALTIEPTNVTLSLSKQNSGDGTTSLSCTVKPDNAHIQEVTWTSSNPDVVTVDEKGVLQAVAPGTANITVRSKDPQSSSIYTVCRVTVLQSVNEITLNKSSLTLNINASETLSATVLPANASEKKVTWESSDPKVATVSGNGTVRAVGPGTAKITCIAADGSKVRATCTVKCIQMITGIKIDAKEKTITLNKDKSTTLKAIIQPANASEKSLNWSSSNPKIVSVTSAGVIKAVSGGSATITCTAKDGSGKSASIEVYVPSISVSKSKFNVGSKSGLDITIYFYGKSKDFTYTVNPSTLFDVRKKQNGDAITLSIIPNKAGTATITLKDNSDRRSETKITVEILHSACYDTTSYPRGDYSSVLRKPSAYKGKNMSIYGKVIQIGTSWGSTYMRVATQGSYNGVFYVECTSRVASGIIEDDYITIYGTCGGTKTYTTVLGASVTIPYIEAEKIVFGKK